MGIISLYPSLLGGGTRGITSTGQLYVPNTGATAYDELFPDDMPYMLNPPESPHPVDLFGPPPGSNPDPTPYLLGRPKAPPANEAGWKDTFQMNPGEVTRVLVRYAPQKGGAFPFDPTTGKYVWHCHILEHEENEMMLPFRVMP